MAIELVDSILPDGEKGQCGFLSLEYGGYLKFENICEIGQKYCLSLYTKADKGGLISLKHYELEPCKVTSTWGRKVIKFEASSRDIEIYFSPGDYYLYKGQLEKGSIESDWKENDSDSLRKWCYDNDLTYIDGAKIYTGTVSAEQINVDDLFAKNIFSKGTMEGAKIKGASGEFTEDFSVKTPLKESDVDDQNIFFQIINNADGVFVGIKSQEQANAYLSLTALGAVLAAQSLKLNGNGVSITAQKGMTLDGGTGISIPCEVFAGNNVRCNGDYYHNNNLVGETVVGIKDSKSIKQAEWMNTGASITLPAGVYMMVGTVRFESCKAGRLGVRFATGGVSYDQMTTLIPGLSTNAARTNVQVQWIMNVTKDTKYDLQAFQSSDAAVSCSSWIKTVRIS